MKLYQVKWKTIVIFATTFIINFLISFNYLEASTIVDIQVVELSGRSHADIPVTFGQVFAIGDVPNGFTLAARNMGGIEIPVQIDAKTRHADGSLRHAILTLIVPNLQANSSER